MSDLDCPWGGLAGCAPYPLRTTRCPAAVMQLAAASTRIEDRNSAPEVCARLDPSWPRRVRGSGRCRLGQCRQGIGLRATEDEQSWTVSVGDQGRAVGRDDHLDRKYVSPTPPTGSPGPIGQHRIRGHRGPDREPRGLKTQLTCSCGSPVCRLFAVRGE